MDDAYTYIIHCDGEEWEVCIRQNHKTVDVQYFRDGMKMLEFVNNHSQEHNTQKE